MTVEPVVTAAENIAFNVPRELRDARAAPPNPPEPPMAVYTEVSDDELARFIDSYGLGAGAVVQGHRRGRREHQLSWSTPQAAGSS